QVVSQQNALRALTDREVHDPALEALIDEVGVARIRLRSRDRRAPDRQSTKRIERLQEIHRLTVEGVRNVLLDEVENVRRIRRRTNLWRVVLHGRVSSREGAAVDLGVR